MADFKKFNFEEFDWALQEKDKDKDELEETKDEEMDWSERLSIALDEVGKTNEKEHEEELEEIKEEEPRTKKGKELEDKIDSLYEKIENEKSTFKRHFNQFLVRQLKAKLDREISKAQIKKEYEIKKEELSLKKSDNEKDLEANIAHLIKKQRFLKQKLRANEEYDYKSKNFIYPKKYVEEKGGIDSFVERLGKSSDLDSRETAKKIKDITTKRDEFNKTKEEMKNAQNELAKLNNIHNKEVKKLKKEEKSLVVKKNGPLSSIKGWFKNVFAEAKEYIADKKEEKDERKQRKVSKNATLKFLEAEKAERIAEAEAAYERQKREFEENAAEFKNDYEKTKRSQKLKEFQEKNGIKVALDQLGEIKQNTEGQIVQAVPITHNQQEEDELEQ